MSDKKKQIGKVEYTLIHNHCVAKIAPLDVLRKLAVLDRYDRNADLASWKRRNKKSNYITLNVPRVLLDEIDALIGGSPARSVEATDLKHSKYREEFEQIVNLELEGNAALWTQEETKVIRLRYINPAIQKKWEEFISDKLAAIPGSLPSPAPPKPEWVTTCAEETVIAQLMESQGLSRPAVLRQALRTYQLTATGHAKLICEIWDKKNHEDVHTSEEMQPKMFNFGGLIDAFDMLPNDCTRDDMETLTVHINALRKWVEDYFDQSGPSLPSEETRATKEKL